MTPALANAAAWTTDAGGTLACDPCSGSGNEVGVSSDLSISIQAKRSKQTDSKSLKVTTIINNQGRVPAPLLATLFSVGTTSGLSYLGTYTSCGSAASLMPGRTVECDITFGVGKDSPTSANQLGYQTPGGEVVTVSIATAACDMCSGACTDLASDPKNCGVCGTTFYCGSSTSYECVDSKAECTFGGEPEKAEIKVGKASSGACANLCATVGMWGEYNGRGECLCSSVRPPDAVPPPPPPKMAPPIFARGPNAARPWTLLP